MVAAQRLIAARTGKSTGEAGLAPVRPWWEAVLECLVRSSALAPQPEEVEIIRMVVVLGLGWGVCLLMERKTQDKAAGVNSKMLTGRTNSL